MRDEVGEEILFRGLEKFAQKADCMKTVSEFSSW